MLKVSFDIDGVISDYPIHFLDYVYIQLSKRFTDLHACKSILGIEIYEEMKARYRQSTFKYQIPIHSEIVEISKDIYRNGGQVSVHSSRPFTSYPNMLRNTTDWLVNGGMSFEKISEKTLTNIVANRCQVHVDDEILRLDPKKMSDIKWVCLGTQKSFIEEPSVTLVESFSQLRKVLSPNL
jgi:hypothetical protein